MNVRRFSSAVSVLTLLLPVQFLLGIWINLFVDIPDPVVANFFTSPGGIVLVVRILNGLTIATLGIVSIVFAGRLNSGMPLLLSILATIFVFLAIVSGVTFVFFGQNDVFSFTMAIGFVSSVVLFSFAGRLAMQPR